MPTFLPQSSFSPLLSIRKLAHSSTHTYSGVKAPPGLVAFSNEVNYRDGDKVLLHRRDRPHRIFDSADYITLDKRGAAGSHGFWPPTSGLPERLHVHTGRFGGVAASERVSVPVAGVCVCVPADHKTKCAGS